MPNKVGVGGGVGLGHSTDLKGDLARKGAGVFVGGLIPQCTYGVAFSVGFKNKRCVNGQALRLRRDERFQYVDI